MAAAVNGHQPTNGHLVANGHVNGCANGHILEYEKDESVFSKYWDADDYVDTLIFGTFDQCYAPLMKILHQYADVVPAGRRLMSIGNGPCVLDVMHLSRKFDELYITDYLPTFRKSVEEWWLHGTHDQKWTPLFEKAAVLEGTSAQQLKDRVRSKIRAVMSSDAYKRTPVDDTSMLPVDLVLSCWALTYTTSDYATFTQLCENVASMLAPGGYMIMSADLNRKCDICSFDIRSKVDSCVFLTPQTLRDVFHNIGMQVVCMEKFCDEPGHYLEPMTSDSQIGQAVVLARKPL